MAHISKNQKLNRKKKRQLYKHFIKSIIEIKTEAGGEIFINEVLTPTEIEMISKRFAALVLIAQSKLSYYRIAKLLKMNQSTISRLSKGVKDGRYKYVIKSAKQSNAFVEYLGVLFDIRLMPEPGRSPWQFLDEIYGTPHKRKYKKRSK